MERSVFKIEICANSVLSCIEAQKGGADRVELCAGIPEGGTTPSAGMIRSARESVSIGLNVIIRPRGGDFLYSDEEVREMLYDIRIAKEYGADGLVFGCLTPDGDIDMVTMRRLMDAAGNTPVTFHRAFDHARDPYGALEKITGLGCRRILTSGQKASADLGCGLLASLVERARGRIIIMPGCGVNASNISRIASSTGAREFHFSARTMVESRMVYRNRDATMGRDSQDYSVPVTSAETVRLTIAALTGC